MFPSYRALARIANAYLKQDHLDQALNYFNKSLSEHRSPDIVKKAQEVRNIYHLCYFKCDPSVVEHCLC